MTDKKSKQGVVQSSQPYTRKSYEDDSGIPHVVLVPPGETDLKRGIPLSLDLKSLYGHMPESFQKVLYEALHAHGLIEPKDYFAQGAAERYQRAMRDVLKRDFLDIQALANEKLQHRE